MDARIIIFLGFLFISIIILMAAAATPASIVPYPLKIILLIIAMVMDIIAFSSRYYSYLIIPFIKQRKKVINLGESENYRISSSEDALIKKSGDTYYATVYLTIPLYRSATEMTPEQRLDFGKQVGQLAGISKQPVRFSTQLHIMNKDSYISDVKDAINKYEAEIIELTKKNAPQNEIEKSKGQVSMWRNILDSSASKQSLELITYASVSSSSYKEAEAISSAQQRGRDIIAGISAIFGISPTFATGEELKRLVEPEYMIPVATISEQITKQIQEEVI